MLISKTQPVKEDQQKPSPVANSRTQSLEAGEKIVKCSPAGPAGITDRIRLESALVWHIQTGGNEESSHDQLTET